MENEAQELSPKTPLRVEELVGNPNIATLLDTEYLSKLGAQIVLDYKEDEQSREEWVRAYEAAMKIATQVSEKKSTPWENASNVRFPLITIGAMQFHARAYPALLPSKGVVQIGTVGIDTDGRKGLISKLISAHMNYQFEYEMMEWEEDMDRLLITLPITGCEFKKTYYDPQKDYNCSEYVRSTDLVINYYAKSVEEAARKTHILSMDKNEITELQRAGLYLDVELGEACPRSDTITTVTDKSTGQKAPATNSAATSHKILEWHGFIDLDDDDYKEPYVVTVDEKSGKVLRIFSRFYPEDITRNADGAIQKIVPIEYFTKYDFIPNPTGGIYGIGFGVLLGPINESANTIINQLVDAGTLSNRQSGFISRNLRIRNGSLKFSPGQWLEVNASGADLSQGILPLPVREPSMVLFQLLNTLISAGERLTSTTDMMVGENPGQNQKATTTMAVLDQGQKVFTAIYKRVRRAMTKEFQKVFALNAYYLNEDKTKILFDGEATMKKEMYNKNNMVVFPTADPNVSSAAERSQTAQVLMSMIPLGGFNEYEIKRRALDALGITDPEALLLDPSIPPPPDPKMIEAQQEGAEQDFRRKLDMVKFIADSKAEEKELEIKEVDAATRRLVAMTQGFVGGATVSNQSRELIQKERESRRKHGAKSGEI